VLFCLRRCGPAPSDQRVMDGDWDEIATAVNELFAREKDLRR
jgi:hypothetical protein